MENIYFGMLWELTFEGAKLTKLWSASLINFQAICFIYADYFHSESHLPGAQYMLSFFSFFLLFFSFFASSIYYHLSTYYLSINHLFTYHHLPTYLSIYLLKQDLIW